GALRSVCTDARPKILALGARHGGMLPLGLRTKIARRPRTTLRRRCCASSPIAPTPVGRLALRTALGCRSRPRSTGRLGARLVEPAAGSGAPPNAYLFTPAETDGAPAPPTPRRSPPPPPDQSATHRTPHRCASGSGLHPASRPARSHPASRSAAPDPA